MRVFELARELNIPGKELINRMRDFGYKVEGNFNLLDDKTVAELKSKMLQPVTRVEEDSAEAKADGEEDGEQPRKRRIISARKSGQVRKIQESMGVSGPLPEDQRTREEVQPESEVSEEEAPTRLKKTDEAGKALEAETPEEPAAKEASPEEVAEPIVASEAPQAEVVDTPVDIKPVGELKKSPRRIEGLPLPKPVEVDSDGTSPRAKGSDAKRGRRGETEEQPTKPAWRDMKREKKSSRGGGEDEWIKPRRSKREKNARRAHKTGGDEAKHTFNPRQKALRIGDNATISELAGLLGVKAADIMRKLMDLGIMGTINSSIDSSTAELIASEYDIQLQVESASVEYMVDAEQIPDADLEPRPPIITIMGHVDHGKTTLLDYIRSTRVASGEAGGITQHIGAYYVKSEAGDMVFLDTPGHEAFTALRQRGANVTDIVVLIVAADDGVMPQTREAIDHAKAAEVPIIVAINKIDRPNADVEKVRNELMQHSLVPEDLGGDTVVAPLSAATGEGVDNLLEMIHLQAEMLELKSTAKGKCRGHVIESQMDRRRGPVATVLVERGTLVVGDHFVAGNVSGRVRALQNDQGESITQATPSQPVEVLGYDDLPGAGDLFTVVEDEKSAKQVSEMRADVRKEEESVQKRRVHLEDFLQTATGDQEEMLHLNLVLKADTQGSLEALKGSLEKEGNQNVEVQLIRAGVGGITETDVSLAATSNAVVIGFNVRPELKASDLARNEGIDLKTYTIIYELINDVHAALEGMLKPIVREEVMGHAEIRDVFSVTKEGRIGGGYLTEGKIDRENLVRVYRDNVLIHSGNLNSLRRFKDDVGSVQSGQEFGFRVANFNDLRSGDVLEAVIRVEEKPTLERAGRS